MVVGGHNLGWGSVDRDGRLADVREIIPGDDLYIGNTSMRNQTSPGV